MLLVVVVAVWLAQIAGSAGVEVEYEPAQLFVFVVYWIEPSAVRVVGAVVEWVSVGCNVLVWRSSDQVVDVTV